MTDSSVKLKIYKKFVELSSSSSFHGYPNMFRTNYWPVRIMWLACFLGSAAFCGFIIYKSVNDYLNYDVVTEIREYKEAPSPFPTITICNINPFATFFSFEYLIDIFNAEFGNGTTANNSLGDNKIENYKIIEYVHEYFSLLRSKALNFVSSPSFSEENRTRLGYSIDEMLIKCTFNGIKCSNDDFRRIFLYDYGNCYQFNSNKDANESVAPIKNAYEPGFRNGLYLELLIYEGYYSYSFQPETGAILFAHNQTSRPMNSPGIKLKTNIMTSIGLSKQFSQKQPYPSSDCRDLESASFNRLFYDLLLASNYTYKQKDCYDLCLQSIIIKQCGCYDLRFLPLDDNSTPCLSFAEFNCTKKEHFTFASSNVEGLCDEYCPLECDSQTIDYRVSISNFPALNYHNILKENPKIFQKILDQNEIDQNLMAVHVYYEELKYTLISESLKSSVYDIVANIGGLLKIIYF